MKITVAGLGYVGLSLSVLLSRLTSVQAYDVDEQRISLINKGISPIADTEIQDYLSQRASLDLTATSDAQSALADADIVVVATPTNYDDEINEFDTSSVFDVVKKAHTFCPAATIIIKSTVPVGFTAKLQEIFPDLDIAFSPEFLREGKALYDNLHPSRIIIGGSSDPAREFGELLARASATPQVPVNVTSPTEAEAVKLFSNTFLAMRVAFFNELDTFATIHELNTKNILDGVCLDPRIGDYYNNPSFGYGGYCLPKDTKQLLANFTDTPQSLIRAIVESNKIRKNFIAEEILRRQPNVVGVFRLTMKSGSDNFRESSILDIVHILESYGVEILVYEPNVRDSSFEGHTVCNDINWFAERSDLIVANRWSNDLLPFVEKVYTRDVFGEN
ncbi:nucleotide sugar dehydrogenase [Brevibacterium paucivorans]|uniref:UDP-glucose 6-dehydrogenase n=1 Tax=Brevibacterium paucivorans TaxID=170994 RepID=A0A2N6VMR4_9MICO|nr:nucleotide sugar dehydrogenase [Brevibacterium paucivorans]PMD05313.1 UDP-glucose 6-dehydrogenase [Brevibacterium paucivorans]